MEYHWVDKVFAERVRLEKLITWQYADWALRRQQAERGKKLVSPTQLTMASFSAYLVSVFLYVRVVATAGFDHCLVSCLGEEKP